MINTAQHSYLIIHNQHQSLWALIISHKQTPPRQILSASAGVSHRHLPRLELGGAGAVMSHCLGPAPLATTISSTRHHSWFFKRSPSNIIRSDDGDVLIVTWGCARIFGCGCVEVVTWTCQLLINATIDSITKTITIWCTIKMTAIKNILSCTGTRLWSWPFLILNWIFLLKNTIKRCRK